ncbi:MAG TPA: hypothetical protein VMT03_04220 [Polyangia bacterium]|nr:hypothetical protein [Polyangia bacterium]
MQARSGTAWLSALSVLGLLSGWSGDGRALSGRRAVRPELGADDQAIADRAIHLPAVVVGAASEGPTIQPAGGPPRTPGTVRPALAAIRLNLVECYRWARFRQPALEAAAFTVDMRLDRGGTVSLVAVEPPSSVAAGEVAACLREVLGTLRVDLYAAHVTDLVPDGRDAAELIKRKADLLARTR